MKKLLFILIAGVMSFGTINAQLVSVFHEVFYADDATVAGYPAGHTTYRIYASMTDPTDFMSSVYAATNDILTIGSSTNTIWNSGFGATTGDAVNAAFFGFVPSLQYDSFVTIGRESNASAGSAINYIESLPGTAVSDGFNTGGTDEFDTNVTMLDGAWFALNGDINGLGTGADNRVLLAQVTTDGDVMYNLNLQVFPLGDGLAAELYVGDCNTVDAGDNNGACMGLHYPEDAICCAPPSDCGTNVVYCYTDFENQSWTYSNDSGSGVVGIVFASGSVESATFDQLTVYDGPDNTFPVIFANVAGSTTDLAGEEWYATGNDITLEIISDSSFSCDDTNIAGPWVYDIFCGTPVINGCMDTTACNYDSTATVDDGSCLADTANDMCMDAIDITANINGADVAADNGGCTTESGMTHSCTGFGANFDVFYSFTYSGGDVTIETLETGTNDDTRMSIWDMCGGTEIACNDDAGAGFMSMITVGCPELTIGNTYIIHIGGYNGTQGTYDVHITQTDVLGCTDSLAVNYDACANVDDLSCTYTIDGCTDSTACNYDSLANNDDGTCCFENCVMINVGGSGFNSEISWDLYDGGGTLILSGGAPFSQMMCLADDCYSVDMFDSFGDGWNGGTFDFGGMVTDLDGAPIGDGSSVGTDYFDLGATGTCPVFGCTDPIACNYDSTATIDDGSCSTDNDAPGCATAIMPSAVGTCNAITGSLLGATNSPESDYQFTGTGADRWYSFVAMSPGASIKMTTVDFDAQLILLDAAYNEVDEDDANFSIGDEILNIGNLIEGDTYFISASSWSGAGATMDFELCVETLPDTRCDYGAGPYELCDMFKADWVGSAGYHFYFTGQTDAITYDLENFVFPQDYVQLFNVANLPWDQTYDVAIDALYNRADGNGAMEQVDVVNNEPCTLIIDPAPLSQVNPAQNCTNHGPHWLGDYIASTPWVCGSVDWTWEFTRTDVSELPFEHAGSTFYNYLRLSDVAGLVEGGTYDVRVKAEFANAAPTVYGATQCISLIGPAGEPLEGPVNFVTNDERIDEVVSTPEASIYPNPNAGDFFNINLVGVQSEIVTVDIYDVFGKLVQAEELTVNDGSVNSIVKFNDEVASGIYMVSITMDGITQVERLSIQK